MTSMHYAVVVTIHWPWPWPSTLRPWPWPWGFAFGLGLGLALNVLALALYPVALLTSLNDYTYIQLSFGWRLTTLSLTGKAQVTSMIQ